jgi:hypothetical protein
MTFLSFHPFMTFHACFWQHIWSKHCHCVALPRDLNLNKPIRILCCFYFLILPATHGCCSPHTMTYFCLLMFVSWLPDIWSQYFELWNGRLDCVRSRALRVILLVLVSFKVIQVIPIDLRLQCDQFPVQKLRTRWPVPEFTRSEASLRTEAQ